MITNRVALGVLGVLLFYGTGLGADKYVVASQVDPPGVPREFRGFWVASVANIDWPSRKGLSSVQQQRELLAILDRAVRLRMNAVILQVRPACDALYQSSYEPWSEYLSGRMGVAPAPYYDPLQFAVEQAHRRGLELHAWFNPFRARHSGGRSPAAPSHISRTQPALVRRYVSQLWLDPGEPAVKEHTLRVIMDVVRRYDIDGVHLDDYFYPYPQRVRGRVVDFPDGPSWGRYLNAGGKLDRKAWRRSNVDRFVQSLYQGIKREKPWVKVGLSPFGIWRPGYPAQIRGLDAYDELYADSRKWLLNGWLDYCAPQLYWSISDTPHSFPALLKWWASQNVKNRHLWPGISANAIGAERSATEILNQVTLTRREPGVRGHIHWSVKALLENRREVARQLLDHQYTSQALVPASPWLDRVLPSKPKVGFNRTETANLIWKPEGREVIRLWVVQTRSGGGWKTDVLPGHARAFALPPVLPEVISIAAVDRVGNVGMPLVLEKKKE